MQLELDLGNPGYTLLHRAGLAGLWMTLKQLAKEKVTPPGTFQWQLNHRQVILNWEGQDLEVLHWLLQESFQVADGLIALRGLDSKTMRPDSQVIAHQGVLGTFLQHTSTHKAAGTETKAFELEPEKPPIIVTYKFLSSYVYQEFAKSLCDQKGSLLKTPITVAGWLNPGASVRHIAFSSNTSFEELAENALLLLFAPVACYYFLLRSKLRDKRSQYALVIPEVINLEQYARYRQDSHLRAASYKDFFASGLGDAGLRFLTYKTTVELAQTFGLKRCQIITLGTVAWASQQKTRTDVCVVEANEAICENYRLCCNWFSDRVIPAKDGSFVASSFAREFIAENLAMNQPWYAGLAGKINSNELFEKLNYERRGLYEMVKHAEYDERDKLFVQTCHEAIKFTYGRISKNTKPGENLNFERATIRIRTKLSRCKSAETFREFIADFWSRAGMLPTLQQHWLELMSLVNSQQEWKKARDLALLALASYKRDENGEDKTGEDDELIDIDIAEI